MTLTILGLFAGIPLFLWLTSVTVIDTSAMLFLLFACGSVGLLKWRYAKQKVDMTFSQFAMYAYTGFGICFANLILLINYTISIGSYTDYYQVRSFNIFNSYTDLRLYSNTIESGLERCFNHYIDANYEEMPIATRAEADFQRGILGLRVVKKMRFHE